ncbi:hypothetical protein CsatB_008554 [Cannabis sativa]
MCCVSSVSYNILSGGKELGPIVPKRGLRQGDPLSPYLFLLCAEGLSALISDFERRGKLRGCKVARGAPVITHMFFADDSYLYCRATEEEANNVIELLQCFQLASGQQVNLNKSSVFFSANTGMDIRARICSILRVQEAGDTSTYLGLPNILGRNKNALLGFLKDKMRKKIQSWEGKFLSKAGKELMLKTVAQSLPSYAMNVFLLPLKTVNEMEQLMCKYWWKSSSQNNKGIHWKSWDKLKIHKSKGGMGFRDLHDFNLSLLSKQGWRLLCKPHTLVGRLFQARYFAGKDFLRAELGSNPSFVWRSIFETVDMVRMGARRRVGNGSTIHILSDPWLPCDENPRVSSNHPALLDHNVDALMETDCFAWDVDLVRDLFNTRDAQLILSIPLNSSRSDDVWFWSFESSGNFSVKSMYRHLQQRKEDDLQLVGSDFWGKLWRLKVPPKVKDLVWRAASNCLPTKSMLRYKRVNIDATCPVCSSSNETILHRLVDCSFARACWVNTGLGVDLDHSGTFTGWIEASFQSFDGDQRKIIAMTCWAIWKARNDCVWKEKTASVAAVTILASSMLEQWSKAQDKTHVPTAAFLSPADGALSWQKPATGEVKINTDAALFSDPNRYSFACVARDDSGHVLEAISSCKLGVVTPELAEAMGVREALSWLKKKGWNRVTIESDSLTVVQALRSSLPMSSYFGGVISDCKTLLESVSDVSILFVKRSANGVAHAVARASSYVADRVFRSNDFTSDIRDVIMKEVY